MDYLSAILAVAAVSTMGVMTPGPDFVAVTYSAVTASRRQAFSVAAGVVAGNGVWAGAALFGIGAAFALFPTLFIAIKMCGAAYLCWCGAKLLRNARKPFGHGHSAVASSFGRAFRHGLTTTMSNPKAAIFYASALSTAAPEGVSFFVLSAMVGVVLLVASLWFAGVVLFLSTPRASALFRRIKTYFESVFGALLLFFGARQLLSR